MKITITSAGLVVLGAASLQAQYAPAPDLTPLQTTKPWSVSATLRGFYDDNYTTRPNGPEKRDSFGIEISPAVGFNWTLPQTYIGLSYVYGMRYYDARHHNRADHTHQASAKLSHAFTEQYKLDLSDTFVAAQEPTILEGGGLITVPLRINETSIRNTANASFTAGLSDQLGAVLTYQNTLVDFQQHDLSILLDRMEHLFGGNLRWQAMPKTVGVLGYQYGIVDYDSDLFKRDHTSHYVYVGVDQTFTSTLSASARVGAEFTQFNDVNHDVVNPYADANATWKYLEDNSVQLGVKHSRVATDVNPGLALNPTLDQEATTVYGSINHHITPQLTGSVLAQFQHGTFEGGTVNNASENILLVGLNFSYQFNQFLAAEAGYNYDKLDSDLKDRSYNRNRIYLGIRASY